MEISTLAYIVILIFSVVLHEVAHGYAAYLLGDLTAKYAGRLTLNPLKHIDLFGSVLLPAFLVVTGSKFLFGWAKPVPYNPYNLKRGGRFAEALVAFAGPLANILLAAFVALLYKLGLVQIQLAFIAVYMNVFLAILNLIPVPPLDGSKVLPAFLPGSLRYSVEASFKNIEAQGITTMLIVIALLAYFASSYIASATHFVSMLLLGAS